MAQKLQTDDYQIVRGFSFPPMYSRKNVEDAMDFSPGDGDLILTSYPKTGATWMEYILLQIISKGELFPSFKDNLHRIVPRIDLAGVAAIYAQDKPRFYKHHIAYNFVQKNDKSKCIYIYRNPEDTVVSYYHFSRSLYINFPLDFNVFFERFVAGNVPRGNYFQHVLSFYEHREDANLLMVSYEKLQANRRDEILRIAKFLGKEYYGSLLQDEELLDKIMERTSFEYMKNNVISPRRSDFLVNGSSQEDDSKINFFRKGIVGDGKDVLTDNQRQRLKEAAEKFLKGTSVMEEWYAE